MDKDLPRFFDFLTEIVGKVLDIYKGKILLVILGNEVAVIPKNVSLEHEYWKELVAQQHKTKGYKVEKGMAVCEGVVIDLVGKKGNK